MTKDTRIAWFILAYPFALIAIALVLNLLLFGVTPAQLALPTRATLQMFSLAGLVLIATHIWLMTSTELTRLRHGLRATPEEWAEAGLTPDAVPDSSWRELERRHNAHRNATENTVYFALLALPFCLITPNPSAVAIWLLGFAIARLGHCASFLTGQAGWRGLFMSVGLTSLFGLASYLAIALWIS